MLINIQSSVSAGSHKVKYHGAGEDWDMAIENEKGVDVSLLLPQHRARTQPLDYRMTMFVSSESEIKVKVVSCFFFASMVLTPKLTPNGQSAAL